MEEKQITLENCSAKLTYDIKNNSFEIQPHQASTPCLKGAIGSLDFDTNSGKKIKVTLQNSQVSVDELPVSDNQGQGRQLSITGKDPNTGIQLTWLINAYFDHPFFVLRLLVTNKSPEVISLLTLNLLEVDPKMGGAVMMDGELDFFEVGWHDWVYSGLRHADQRDVNSFFALKPFVSRMLFNPANKVGKRKGDFWGDNWGILTDQNSALLTGLVSMADQFGMVHADCRACKAVLTLSTMADGVPLEPGETFESEWGYIEWMSLPQLDPMQHYVQAVARQMKPRQLASPPPTMWTHWYYYFEHITQEQFLDNLESADRLRKQVPYEIFQLDGGYYQHWGDYLDWNERFPIGPQAMSARIREKGFMPGLWLAPFVVDPASNVAKQHPDWLVKDKKGKPIKSGFFYSFYGNALDLTQEAVCDHVRTMLDKLAHELGFGFIKTDFVYAGALPGVRQDPKMTRAQAFRRGMEAVREGIGDETLLLGCGCPMGPAIGIVDTMRIGPDTAPHWEPFLWSTQWATPLIRQDRSVGSLRNNIRHTINLSALHRKWWWNDPDCLMVRSDNTYLTREEVRSNVSLIGSNGNLVIHSDNLAKLSPEEIRWASLVTPNLACDGQALDLLQQEMPELYVVNHDSPAGTWVSLVLFNWSDVPADRSVNLADLGFAPGTPLHGFDFWEEKYFTTSAGLLEYKQIPTHGCKLLRFCIADGDPCLVGDTLHTSQGLEITRWDVNEKRLIISTMDLKREAKGNMWLWLPELPTRITIDQGDSLAFSVVNERVVQIPLQFTGQIEVTCHF